MTYLVDVNVICEPTKAQCDQKVSDWLRDHDGEWVTSAVVLGEIWRGIDALPPAKKKQRLEAWFQGWRANLICLDWTAECAVVWAEMVNRIKAAGFSVGLMDTLIAATAKHHGLDGGHAQRGRLPAVRSARGEPV